VSPRGQNRPWLRTTTLHLLEKLVYENVNALLLSVPGLKRKRERISGFVHLKMLFSNQGENTDQATKKHSPYMNDKWPIK
jgi:hypothetical protein